MRGEIEKLLHLQSLDLKIRDLEREKENNLIDLQELEKKILKEEREVGEERELLKGETVQIKTLELSVQDKKNQINKYDQQLLAIKSNKEYKSLRSEIEGLKADIRVVEDQIIGLMELAEKNNRRINEVEAELESNQSKYREEVGRVKEANKRIEAEKAETGERRKELAATVEDGLRKRYERIMDHKDDRAIVTVENGICRGCHLQLTAQVLNDLKKDDLISYCENCGRIIYIN
jgi:predicted  nucleic acid-binding Zn-ribbon protein